MSGYLENLFNNNDDDRNLSPIVAGIGFNDGANKGFWRIQPRDLHGRWIEMGAEIRAAFKHLGKIISINGHAVGSTGRPDEVRMMIRGMSHFGIPDGIYPVSSKHAELIGATLPDEYLISKGIDPNSVDIHGNTVTDMMKAGDLPEISDLERADITPQDIDLVNGGAEGTPEGKENAAFKSTDEGKKIAELPGAGAAQVDNSAVSKALGVPGDLNALEKAIRKGVRSDFTTGNPQTDARMEEYNDKVAKRLKEKVVEKLGPEVAGSKEFLNYLSKNYNTEWDNGISVGRSNTHGLEEFDKLVDDYAAIAPSPDAEGAPDVAAKAADKAVQDAFEGDNAPDLDSLIDDASGDLLDEPSADAIDELLGPELDTSEFDQPVAEKTRIGASEVEPGDFINHPENDEFMRVDNVEPINNRGDVLISGENRDGVPFEFRSRPGQSIVKSIFGEAGDTSLQDYLATPTVKPVTPKPVDILPKPVTVPDNAIPAEDFAVGDKVWDARGHEIGTVRKVLEKGFDNFGRDYTKAEVVGSDGKVSTTRLGHERGLKKVPAPEKPIAPEKPVAPVEPAPIPEPVQVELPNTPAVTPAVTPETPEDLTPATKKAEDLVPGDTIHNANGTSGQVTSVSNENGKVTVNYTDQNGEAKSKRFLEGNDVNTKPTSGLAPDREANGNPISDIQKQTLEDLDAMDSADPIEDKALKQRLMDAYNAAQDGDFQDEGEVQDLIDEVNAHFLSKKGGAPATTPATPTTPPVVRRGDHGRDIAPTEKTVEEMRKQKIKMKDGAQDPDVILSQLAEDYPDGFFIDKPGDPLNGGFMTHRRTIDGGRTRLETVVTRTNGNQFEINFRFTDLKTGEVTDLVHRKDRDSYGGGIHGKENGIEILTDYFSGVSSPRPPGNREYKAYFAPGKTWKDRMGYWRKGSDPSDLRMVSKAEKYKNMINGRAEVLNETTAEYLGNKMQSFVPSFIKAVMEGDSPAAKVRFQEMMNQLTDNNASGNEFVKVVRASLKEALDASGVTGKERTRALQQLSATVTNYILHANKQWSLDNEIKLPHISGGGLIAVKEGKKVQFTDNMGRPAIGRVVGLRRVGGPHGYTDYVRLQFLGKDGKLHTSDADLVSAHMKLVDDNTPLTEYEGWDRLGDLTFSRLGQEATDKRKAARLKKGMSWQDPESPDYNPNKIGLSYLGSDGKPSVDEPSTPSIIPSGVTKQAAELLSGDTIYSPEGKPLGTVVKTKITSKNGQPIVAVMYKDAEGNVHKLAYHPDQEIGPDAPKA